MMLEESPTAVAAVVPGSRPPLTRQKRMSKQSNGLINKFLITQLDITTFKPSITFKWIPKGKTEGKDEADDAKIQQFCFPESNQIMLSLTQCGNEVIDRFSFILTNSLGGKSFAYCKRFIKPDTQPYCYVFISVKPHFSLYDEIFELIEPKFERNLKYSINALLNSLLWHPIGNESTKIKLSANNSQTENYEVNYNHPRSEFQHITYETIYDIKPNHLVKLFEAMLSEARIILCSSKLSIISNSIMALHSLISPFFWQHIFIAILPEPLMPYVSAPIPFLVGILDSSLKSFYQQPTEQVILYNLDKCEFMIDPGFKSVLPTHIINYMESSLKRLKNEQPTYNRSIDSQIRKPFYSVIYHLFQTYNQYMYRNGDHFRFNKDQFIEQAHTGQTKKLIELLVCSQMIEMFFNQKENEFTKMDDSTLCPFLLDARESCDKIPTVASKRQSQYDCPICMESTTSRPSLEFNGFTLHQDCFRCKMCSTGLRELEREKIILKKKDGERIQVYCADCRSNFFNKIKKSSSAKQFINLFKVDSDQQSFMGGVNPTQISVSPSKGYPILPVKSEIQNFKFQNRKPPPKDLGGKSLSHGRFMTPREIQSSTLPLPSTSSGSSGNKKSTLNINSNRFQPPLPPTPDEKKERAFEQMKIKNIHIFSGDDQYSADEENSSASSTPSNTPPKVAFASAHINHEARVNQFSKALPDIPQSKPLAQNPQQEENNVNFKIKGNQAQSSLPPLPQVPQVQGRPLPIPPTAVAPAALMLKSTSPYNRSPPRTIPSPRTASPRNQNNNNNNNSNSIINKPIPSTYSTNKKPLPSPSPSPPHQNNTFIPKQPPLSQQQNSNVNDVSTPTYKTTPLPSPTPTRSIKPIPQIIPKPNPKPTPQIPVKQPVAIPPSSSTNNRQNSPRGVNTSGTAKSASPDNSLSPRRLNKQCYGCKEQLTCTTQIMVANGNYYHKNCFTCAKCTLPLQSGEYFFHVGSLYHFACSTDILPSSNNTPLTNTGSSINLTSSGTTTKGNNYNNKSLRRSTNSISLSGSSI